jgi:hypothetical protein
MMIYADGNVSGKVRNDTLKHDATLEGTVGGSGSFTGYYRFAAQQDPATYLIRGQLLEDGNLDGKLTIAESGKNIASLDFSLHRVAAK